MQFKDVDVPDTYHDDKQSVDLDSSNTAMISSGSRESVKAASQSSKEDDTRYERLSKTLEIAIQAAGMGVWEWTLNSQVNVWNRRTREIFGIHTESEIVSHDYFMELVHPDDRDCLNEKLHQTVQELGDIDVDYRINHSRKGVRYIKAKAKCHKVSGEPTRYVGIVWDITDSINAEQERMNLSERLSHGQRLQSIGELTGGIAHDFNNLLAVISGNAELLSASLAEGSKHLDAIVSASQRGAALTRGLLAFSRKQALRPASVDLSAVVNNLCLMLDRTLSSTVSISTQLASDLWQCVVDPAQVENALINLIVNARDAMPGGGTIVIETENCMLNADFASLADDVVPGEFVKVSVSDTGTGMTMEVLKKSIDPFFTTKPVGDGHGLGLSTVFGFMKQSNGHMTIDSVSSQGTRVSLYFPRHEGALSNTSEIQDKSTKPLSGAGQTILLVEDDAAVQDMLRTALTCLGYKTFCVSSGAEAIILMHKQQQTIDLVMSDVVLTEGMNGFELGQQLSIDYPDTRIMYISGYAQDALKKLGMAQKPGANHLNVDVLEKPFSIDRLAECVARKLESAHEITGCKGHSPQTI